MIDEREPTPPPSDNEEEEEEEVIESEPEPEKSEPEESEPEEAPEEEEKEEEEESEKEKEGHTDNNQFHSPFLFHHLSIIANTSPYCFSSYFLKSQSNTKICTNIQMDV